MTLSGRQNIQRMSNLVPTGTVILSSWLAEQGFSPQLQRQYRTSGWLKSIGTGAMIRPGDTVGWEGALYALQNGARLPVHVGGKTALAMQGKSHFLELSRAKVFLFGRLDTRLPKWFERKDWGVEIDFHRTGFLPTRLGMTSLENGTFSIMASDPARALMECLRLSVAPEDFLEARELMDGLNNLRPAHVQELLQSCGSIKVKRLFLYLAGLAGHAWLRHVDRGVIDLGSGTRSLGADGTYVPEFDMMVPREFAANAKPGV